MPQMTVLQARMLLARNAAWHQAERLTGEKSASYRIDPDRLTEASAIVAQHGSIARPGYVYIIKDRSRVKIGYTINISQRLATLQRQSGRPLRLVVALPGSYEDESALHRRFAAYRGIGEWFRLEGELKEFARRPVRNLRAALNA